MTKWICKQCRAFKETESNMKPDHTHDWTCIELTQRDPVLLREVTTRYDVILDKCKEPCQTQLRG